MFVVFFFKQKTAYEMRISDWSSDVCSSDLRGLGFCGLSERCDEAGARLMHDAFGLRATLLFDLAPGEYHTNVVLAVLSGRAALVCPGGFADQAAVEAIAGLYAPHVAMLSPAEHAAFAGNSISAPRSEEHTSEPQ